LLLACGSTALAQDAPGAAPRKTALDTVVGWQDFFGDDGLWKGQVIVDVSAAAEIADRTQIAVRPVLWRVGGQWETLLDQALVRHEFGARVRWRVEGGRFASPVGFGLLENRANQNAGVLWCHRPYYMPLPSLGQGTPMLSLVSAVYPTGVQVAASSDRWDVRGAVLDTAPVSFWQDVHKGTTRRSANGVIGGGVTPRPGLRVGAATAWGSVRGATVSNPPVAYGLVNLEAEYAIGHTKVSGEWTRDRFDLARGPVAANGWTLQAAHALTPRLFVHSRATVIEAPSIAADGGLRLRQYRSADSTVGYRLDPDVTLRIGHAAVKRWRTSDVDHQVGVSLVWARRWW
jgi:hypothetical protein